ncbi:hypothetical protein MUP77_01190, partial [Candidatus Bathyarchaeota archaeon]|nr:hypothetical protein [Candidatus Bathyarchaeota archaeon]
GGLVIATASINIQNSGSTPISNIKLGFSKNFEQNLDDVIADGSQKLNVVTEGVKGDAFWLDISFVNAVDKDQPITLSVYFIFSGLISYNQSNPTVYTVIFPASIVFPIDVDHFGIDLKLPNGVIPQESSLSGLLSEPVAPLSAYTTVIGFVKFTGDIRILECGNANSEIFLDSWSSLSFYDTYTIRNIGKISISDIVLRLPLDAKEIVAFDTGGSLSVTINNLEEGKQVKISLRYKIRGIDGLTGFYESCSFTVKYKVTNPRSLVSNSWGKYKLRLIFPTYLNLTLKKFSMRITLPEGAKYQASSHNGNLSMNGFTPSLLYIFKSVNPVSVSDFIIDYDYLIFWAAFRPTIWVGGLVVTISMFMLYRGRKRIPSQLTSNKNAKLLNSFTNVSDERLMTWSELDSLEENHNNRGIGVKDYTRRKKIIQERLKVLDGEWTGLKTDVSHITPRYAELTSKMEKAEAEILALRANIDKVRTQYHSGRLSKRSYEELKYSYEKKVEGSKRTIESIIVELKSTF